MYLNGDIKMNKLLKIVVIVFLFSIIFCSCLYLYKTGKSAFTVKKIIKYNNGCEEIYVGGNLTTDKCADENGNNYGFIFKNFTKVR